MCTRYMIKVRYLFVQLDKTPRGLVGAANSAESRIEGTGTVVLHVQDAEGSSRRMTLKDSLYVPTYSRNSVSVKKLNDAGVHTEFGKRPHLTVQFSHFY